MVNSVVDCWGEGSIRGLNGNGKDTINIKLKKKRKISKFNGK